MGRPLPPPPAFDDRAPWGAYRPGRALSVALAVAHAMPGWLAPVTRALRRPVKYRRDRPLDLAIWGYRLRLLPRGNVSEQKLYTAPQLFDPAERAAMRRRLRPEGVFVDVGANAGAYGFWASRCMGTGTVLAVEPDPEMRRRLRFNCATNGVAMRVAPVALSDREGQIQLRVNPAQRGENTVVAAEAARAGGARDLVSVPVTTLTALLAAEGIDRIDVLKIDIEGHEAPVLRHFLSHAPKALWPGAIISEFKADTAEDILTVLEGQGYRRTRTTGLNFILER